MFEVTRGQRPQARLPSEWPFLLLGKKRPKTSTAELVYLGNAFTLVFFMTLFLKYFSNE